MDRRQSDRHAGSEADRLVRLIYSTKVDNWKDRYINGLTDE